MNLFKIPNFLSIEECDVIHDRILETEDYVKSLGDDIYKGTADNSLTGRFWCHNYLYDKVISDIIIPKLRIVVGRRKFIQCWANTLRNREGIARHCHRNPNSPEAPPVDWTCANLFIGGNAGLGTWFEGERYDNNRGELMLFASNIYHWVPPNTEDTPRVTMAMNIHTWPKPKGGTEKQYYEMK